MGRRKTYLAILDNSGSVLALLDFWGEEMKTELQQLTEAKLLLFELAEEMERDGYETLPKKAKQWLKENGPTAKRTAYPPNDGTQRRRDAEATNATETRTRRSLE